MKPKERRAHIDFATKMLGRDGVGCLILAIPLAIFGKTTLALMFIFYASLRYHQSWNHDDLKDRLKKLEEKKK